MLVLGHASREFTEACEAAGYAVILLAGEAVGVSAPPNPRPSVIGRSRAELERTSSDWFTVALGVLEQAPLTQIATVLFNFAQLTKDRALVSISTRPRGEEGGSLLPKPTWVKLLTMAGFDVIETLHQRIHHPADRSHQGHFMPCVTRLWQQSDPFGDAADRGPLQLVLTKSRTVSDLKQFQVDIEEFLDVAYIREKWSPSNLIRRPVIFNIHHLQDFLHLRPVVDLTNRKNTGSVAFLRECAGTTPIQRVLISHALRALGIEVILYRRVAELPWNRFNDAVMLSASESGVTESHALSRQLVTAARMRALPTYLLQHGVWIEQFGSPISFGSDYVLTWGDEHRAFFEDNRRHYLGLEVSNGANPPDAFIVTGGSRLAEAVAPGAGALQARLAVPSANFEKTILIGTNFHWGAHAEAGSTLDVLGRLAARHREWLFILKPHPLESAADYSELIRDNVVCFDDHTAILTDYHTPRVLRGVDAVASSLSSLLIDAAVAGRKIFQYATDNPYRYVGVTPRPMEQLPKSVIEHTPDRATEVVAQYAEGDHRHFWKRLAKLVGEATAPSGGALGAAHEIALLDLIEDNWARHSIADLRLEDLIDLDGSSLFDPNFYALQAGKAAAADDLMKHFLTVGSHNGLEPCALFDTAFYLRQARHAGLTINQSPVLHYIRRGDAMGLSPNPLFDPAFYKRQLPEDIANTSLLAHYMQVGESLGLKPSRRFDPSWYRAIYADLTFVERPLEHFVLFGQREGRAGHPRDAGDVLA